MREQRNRPHVEVVVRRRNGRFVTASTCSRYAAKRRFDHLASRYDAAYYVELVVDGTVVETTYALGQPRVRGVSSEHA